MRTDITSKDECAWPGCEHAVSQTNLKLHHVSPRTYSLGIIAGDLGAYGTDGSLFVGQSIGRLAEELAKLVPNVQLCLPIVPNKSGDLQHVLNYPPDQVHALPPLASTISAQRYWHETRTIIRRFAQSVDVLFVRLPFQLPGTLKNLQCPKVLQVLGNVRAVVSVTTDYNWLVKRAAQLFAWYSEHVSKQLIAEPDTRVVTNGDEMWRLLDCRHGRTVVSSNLFSYEICPAPHFQPQDPPRILFVGYLRPEKGADTLLDAFEMLAAKRPVKLTIVGGSDRASGVEQALFRRVETSRWRDLIEIKGIVPLGERLFDLYRAHDVYVLASHSEGTPRTLIEARAFGCPVVATRVGGVPTSVADGHDGLLVPRSDPVAMANAIEGLLDNLPLREKLINAGIERSRSCTLENFAAQIVEQIDTVWADSKPATVQ